MESRLITTLKEDTRNAPNKVEDATTFTHHNKIKESIITKRRDWLETSRISDKREGKPKLVSSLDYSTRQLNMSVMEPKKLGVESVEDYKVTHMVLDLDQLQYANKVNFNK